LRSAELTPKPHAEAADRGVATTERKPMSADKPAQPDPTGEEEPKPQEESTPEEDLLTRQTTVRETRRLFVEEPAVVPEEADLHQVALLCAERRGVHTVAVVDEQGRLSGVIPLRLLLDELFLHVAPEEILAEVLRAGNIEELGKISRAGRAGEFMQRPVYVTLDDTVKEVFVRMHVNNLEGLPIVNEEMRPVGYVGRFELLRVWLRTHPRHAGVT
jgi:CBS domain-containing protein